MTQEEFEKLKDLAKSIKDTKDLEETTFNPIKSLRNKLLKETYLNLAVIRKKGFKGYDREEITGDLICKVNNNSGKELLDKLIQCRVHPLRDRLKSLQEEFNSPIEL